jgi:hypothetical protein
MITFHPRQSDCARRARKNENSGTFNFTSQIASSICTVMFTKRVKHDANIFKSRCSRTVVCYRLYMKQALPLIFIRLSRLANSSPTNRRSPARRSRNGGEPSHKSSGEMSPSLPHNFPAIAGRWKSQCRRISARATREITRNTCATVSQRLHRSPRNRQCNIPRNIPQADPSKFWHHLLNHNSQQL